MSLRVALDMAETELAVAVAALKEISAERTESEYGCPYCSDDRPFDIQHCGVGCPGVIADKALAEIRGAKS